MKGRDLEAELPLTLEEAHRGGTRVVSVQSWERCRECDGKGVVANHRCGRCAGRGVEPTTNTLEVSAPAGMRDGNVLRLEKIAGHFQDTPGHWGRRRLPVDPALLLCTNWPANARRTTSPESHTSWLAPERSARLATQRGSVDSEISHVGA